MKKGGLAAALELKELLPNLRDRGKVNIGQITIDLYVQRCEVKSLRNR